MLLFYGSLRGAFFVSWGGTASFFCKKKLCKPAENIENFY